MPRPKTKIELLEKSSENYKKLNKLIDAYGEDEQLADFPPGTLNRNIRDVVAHLHHWNIMCRNWYTEGSKGIKPDMPAKGYTWKTLPALNVKINEQYSNTPLSEARDLLEKSHNEMIEIIKKHSNESLFEKKRYKWTGTTSMGAYFVSAVSSHYEWAIKLIKRCKKK